MCALLEDRRFLEFPWMLEYEKRRLTDSKTVAGRILHNPGASCSPRKKGSDGRNEQNKRKKQVE